MQEEADQQNSPRPNSLLLYSFFFPPILPFVTLPPWPRCASSCWRPACSCLAVPSPGALWGASLSRAMMPMEALRRGNCCRQAWGNACAQSAACYLCYRPLPCSLGHLHP